jgi:hypothetical protein
LALRTPCHAVDFFVGQGARQLARKDANGIGLRAKSRFHVVLQSIGDRSCVNDMTRGIAANRVISRKARGLCVAESITAGRTRQKARANMRMAIPGRRADQS